MEKSLHIHKLNEYSISERAKAFWEGYKVEFTKEEFESFKNVNGVRVAFEWENKILVEFEPKKEEWEQLFK